MAPLLGCTPESPYEALLEVTGPVATADAVVWIDRGRHEAVFVRPEGDALQVRRVAVGDERTTVAWAAATFDRRSILALTTPASAKEEDVDEQLYRLPGDGDGEPVIYDVRAPFTALALSPDLRRAVLYFGAGAVDEQLHNANQIAFVDLTGDEAVNVTLNGFGGALRSVEFPGQAALGEPSPVLVGGVQRDIAAFLATSEVVLIDMDDPALDQVAVPLGDDVGFNPVTTLLRPGDPLYADPALFVRPGAGGEVGMLTLLPEADGTGFTAQIGLIPVGEDASDFVTFESATVPYLITVDASTDALIFTDIRTQGGFAVPLEAQVRQIFLREIVGGRQAVAWAPGGATISTLDLVDVEDSLARKPRTLGVEDGIDELVRLDNDRLLIGSGARLYVIDLPSEQVTPLSSRSPYDPLDSALLGDRLLLGTAGQTWVSTVDLAALSPESMLLDAAIERFYYLPGPQRIVVTHASAAGHLTVVDPAEPRRSTSRIHWGFLLEGALDRE
ncbi:MAG: hypothetical protein R3B09_00695 [Nannocystaceae bacterium]